MLRVPPKSATLLFIAPHNSHNFNHVNHPCGPPGGTPMSAEFIRQLRRYAQDAVHSLRAELVESLAQHTGNFANGPLVVDVALPGAAYFSVAAGGLADVLHFLGDHVHVDRFVGASGGACSLFLILANERSMSGTAGPCPDAEELLRSYLMYGESEGTGNWQRSWNACRQVFSGVSNFWEKRYEELLQDERAWTAVRHHAFCAVSARPIRQNLFGAPSESESLFHCKTDNYIMHSFSNRSEAVQSFVATGEATIKGFVACHWYGKHLLPLESCGSCNHYH